MILARIATDVNLWAAAGWRSEAAGQNVTGPGGSASAQVGTGGSLEAPDSQSVSMPRPEATGRDCHAKGAETRGDHLHALARSLGWLQTPRAAERRTRAMA
ncbi:MAG: hypothetical protein AMXMBFR61_21510 [Fimbriimonadales bacterium]